MRVVSALLSVALLPLFTRAAFHSNDTACTRHYTVKSGDTCDKIGQKTLTSTYQILAFNLLDAGGADCYNLEIGSRLCLGRYGNDCQFVHQCTDQDTCESIASAYGISTERLQGNNPSLDCNVVYDGLMLCVSAGSIRPPAVASLNSTDVKVAREQARQAWLKQQHAKNHTGNSKHPSHGEHHKSNGKASHKPKAHQADALPPPLAEQTHSPKQQRAAAEQESFSQPAQQAADPQVASSAPLGSNDTPRGQPPLAGDLTNTPTQHKRHRSLSSRSHHHRSHTP